MNKYEMTAFIEQYLDGELSDAEKKDFELQLKENSEFAKEFLIQNEIRNAIADKDMFEFSEKLKKIRKNYHKQKSQKKKRVLLYYAAASFIGLMILSCYFMFFNSYSNNELYNKYYKHVDSGIYLRGIETIPGNDFNKALKEYEIGKYKEAISHFGKISDTSQYHIATEFFTALSFMEIQRFDDAINHFSLIEDNAGCLFYPDAVWFHGLCCLRTDNNICAQEQFRKLTGIDSGYKISANDILNTID
jgi:hypothetical protein